jgi:ubiquinone/menaquinone biosynthesis C-methylase UbiE
MYSRLFKERGAKRVVGYDVADGMIKYAKEQEEKNPVGIEFISELTPTLENIFDLVVGVYVLPYAATHEELYTMCSTMAGLVKSGGRLITLPIHPEYDPNPKYYEPYGFRLISDNPYTEGGKIQLELCYSNYDVKVTAYYWSSSILKAALIEAGFSSVEQIELFTSSTGDLNKACSTLKNYIKKPHASILECKKEKI